MKKLLNVFITLLLLFSILLCTSINSNAISTKEIDYTETLETFDNPERGFYSHLRYNFKVSGNEVPKDYRLEGNLLHLRLGIGDFSGKVNGDKDLELSEDMLNMFDTILKKIKSNGGTAIVRFAYDNFDGDEDLEPSLDMILTHIKQICPILTQNKDAISYVELGFFGPWGEMHSSKICTPENVTKGINTMLENTPEEIKIGVRQPKYYVHFANVDRAKLNENFTVKGTPEYRVGLFDDGYLGSHSDLGTYENREIEVSWLENQARHTLFGGEVVATRGSEENDKVNTAEYMSKEAFRTHTTYLNYEYDEDVINSWKDETYNGDDPLYKGKSGYLYITNHLGYRFVLRSSNINQTENKKLNLNFDIENVGFANLVIETPIDATTWNSRETSKINLDITLPDSLEETDYNVYLRLSKYGDLNTDNNYQCIRLANNNIWDESIMANYIGSFTYKEQVENNPDTNTDTPDDPNQNEENNNNNNTDNNTDNNSSNNIGDNTNNNSSNNTGDNTNNNSSNNTGDNTNNNTSNNTGDNTNNNTNNTHNYNLNDKGNSLNSSNDDTTVSSEPIPQTGNGINQSFILFLIIINIICSIYFYQKSKVN